MFCIEGGCDRLWQAVYIIETGKGPGGVLKNGGVWATYINDVCVSESCGSCPLLFFAVVTETFLGNDPAFQSSDLYLVFVSYRAKF